MTNTKNKMSEKTLSDKIYSSRNMARWCGFLYVDDVKNFIKKLKEKLEGINAGAGTKYYELFCGYLNKLAGDELI